MSNTAAAWSSGVTVELETLTAALRDLRSRMAMLRNQPERGTPEELELALGTLEVADEELRVADEELRAQRADLRRLIAGRHSDQARRERLWAALPTPVILTDLAGTILAANPRATMAVGTALSELISEPLRSCLHSEDGRTIRDTLSQLGRGADLRRVSVRLRRRGGRGSPVRMLALRDATTRQPAVRWVAVPEDTGDGGEAEAAWVTSTVSLFRSAVKDGGVPRLIRQIAAMATSLVPGADGASMTLGPPDAPLHQVGDGALARAGDGAQSAAEEGPSWDAFAGGQPCHSPDLGQGSWPRLVLEARRAGVRDALAVPIAGDEGRPVGVLTAYAGAAGSMGRRSEMLAGWVAAAGGSLLRDVNERESLRPLISQLEFALGSRGVIEQAKGMVMATSRCTPEDAFRVLAQIGSRENITVDEIARRLVERRPLHD